MQTMKRSVVPPGSHLRWRFGKALLALLLLVGVFCISPAFASIETFKKTYPLEPGGSFLLENVNGSVQV